ncbi:transposase, mutator family [Moorella thermoacetica]|uniref:Mutator family transposase n=1 Tax=Neomoorella thermoacetica TaxID=1525 RepID=A0A1J5NMT3_NEOTH|nr:transposase, mutator family [Moorella thermoacetica]
MPSYHKNDPKRQSGAAKFLAHCPQPVQISISSEVIGAAQEGLMALASATGLLVFQEIMEAEVTAICGPKGKHNPERKAVRHGTEEGSVIMGGRKVAVERPRCRTVTGQEVHLETYTMFQQEDMLAAAVLERMLYGLSTRKYTHGLEPIDSNIETTGVSKSSVSRRFINGTRKALAELLQRRLDEEHFLVLLIDGVVVARHTVVTAIGIDTDGKKHILGLWEGATENKAVCQALLADLVERGLEVKEGILVVIDGSKALAAAVKDAFGNQAFIQRCRVHKKRNVLEHLPEAEQPWVTRKMDAAWREEDPEQALKSLKALAGQLEKNYPGAAASLREGMEETLTVNRLGLPEKLAKSLNSTNIIESANDRVRTYCRNVKRWKNGEQILRWMAASYLEAEKGFHRINGYRELPILKEAMRKKLFPESSTAMQSA